MKTELHRIAPQPPFPNNASLPLVVFSGVFDSSAVSPEDFEKLFGENGWTGSWRNGIFGFHHYHSTAHEALGCYGGRALVQFGGPGGIQAEILAGDAVFVPAGTGHCLLDSQGDFHVVGAYPAGTYPDLCREDSPNYRKLSQTSRDVPPPPFLPVRDPAVELKFFSRS